MQSVPEAADKAAASGCEAAQQQACRESQGRAKGESREAAPRRAKSRRLMAAPRKSGADDLKLITGVGPKLEGVLNELGFWHFDQIAKWTDEEIAWVDSRLKFKGRIARDDWVAQATKLAKGTR